MSDKTVLITGCSSGIGYDAAHGLRNAGWRVFASCRQEKDCQRLRAEGFDSPRIDYTDSDSITSGLQSVLTETGGTLAALYNNGAFACPGAVEDLPRGGLESIFQTNVFGVHDLTCQVIPIMRRQGYGRIVNCSSVLGLVGYKWRGAYVATKFALEGLTDVLRLEMRDTPIKIILLEPGPIASRIRENAIPHFERWFTPDRSLRAAQYVELTKRLYEGGEDRFQLPASAVTAKLRVALEHPRPKARYFITTPTYLAATMRRILPTWAQDALIERS